MRRLIMLVIAVAGMAAVWAAPISPTAARGQAADAAIILPPAVLDKLQQPPITPAAARDQAADAVQSLFALQQISADASFHTNAWTHTVQSQDRAIELDPVGTEPYALAAWLLWSTGKHREAIDYYNRMIIANPKDPNAYYEYGFYFFTQKNDAEAVKWLETAVALGLRSPQRHMYGHALARLGRTEEALAFWRSVLADDPKDEVAQKEIDKLTHPAPLPVAPPPAAVPPAASKPLPAGALVAPDTRKGDD